MVSFKQAIAVLIFTEATTAFHGNSFLPSGHRTIQLDKGEVERRRIYSPTAHFISYSVDGVNFPPIDDDEGEGIVNKWVESKTKEFIDGIDEEQKKEDANERELNRRRLQLVIRSSGGEANSYTVELPLRNTNIGMTIGQILPGRLFSTYELDVDTLKLQLTPTPAEAAAEDSDVRQQRDRLLNTIPDFLSRLEVNLSGLVVTSVVKGSAAWTYGIRPGDLVSAVSATLGDSLWPKSTLEGVQSAISSRRNVVGAQTIQIQLRRAISDTTIPPSTVAAKKGNQFELTLTRPLSFNIRESTDGSGYIEISSISETASPLVKHALQVGDKIVAIGSSVGDQFWPASSTVEGVIAACTGRLPGQSVSIRFERPISNIESRSESRTTLSSTAISDAPVTTTATSPPSVEELRSRCRKVLRRYAAEETSLSQQWQKRSVEKFPAIVADKVVEVLASASADLDPYTLHMIMNAYLMGGKPHKAIRIFEASTGFAGDASLDSKARTMSDKEGKGRITPSESALSLYTCTALLRAHSIMGNFSSVRRVLLAMEGKSGDTIGDDIDVAPWPWTGALGSLKPDTVCYNIAIGAAERVGGSDAVTVAMEIFGKMIPPTKGVTTSTKSDRPIQNVVTFNTLISALANEGRSREAFGLFDRMQRVGLRPDKYTYTALIKVCANDGDLEELMYDMKARGVQPDVVTYNTIIKSLCEKRQWTQATRLISEMEAKGVSPDSRTYSLLMNEMLKEGKPSACLTLFESACASSRTSTLTDNVYLYTIAISAASKLGDHQRALEFIARMNAQGVKPNLLTLTAVMGACMASGEPDVAVQVFKRIEQPDGYAVAQGIRAMCESGQLVEASKYLQQQHRATAVMSGKETMQTYNHFFKAALERGELQLARQVLKDLLGKGYLPSKSIFQAFNDAFQLNDLPKKSATTIERDLEADLPKFQFLLFVIDSILERNIPVEGSIFTSAITLGNQLGGLPRKVALLMSNARSETSRGTQLLGTGAERDNVRNEDKLELKWEELLVQYDNIPKDKFDPASLPPLSVRVASKDVRRVLRAEVALSYANRSKSGKLKSFKITQRETTQTQQRQQFTEAA